MNLFLPLPEKAESIATPERFPYPFVDEVHPLSLAAKDALIQRVQGDAELWADARQGKMLGVLVVEWNGERGYLSAFSGTLCRKTLQAGFVPPVYDLMQPGSYFQQEQDAISAINQQLRERDDAQLQAERARRSRDLQQWLFQQYHFLNARGEERTLPEIFGDVVPPGGAGDCCAPKLLQYAYQHAMRPLCLAEFWVGDSPRGEIRTHGRCYAPCRSRCFPILNFMLQGLDVEPNPLLTLYHQQVDAMREVYRDADCVVISKPSGMLSVPGKDAEAPSVQSVVRERFPEATGPLIVHRLDMDTSGLMILALNDATYHTLQDMFLRHEIGKTYVALLERPMTVGEEGTISLPLRPDIDDRPRQMVDPVHGKRAVTHYRVLDNVNGHARVELQPETGRTHQLRVHCAHPEGLNNPILGDRLYGDAASAERLMLHAAQLIINDKTYKDEPEY